MARIVKNDEKTIATNPCTLAYVHVFEPFAFDESQAPKYSVVLLINKSDDETVDYINNAIKAAEEQGKERWHNRIPSNIQLPLHDGDDKAEQHPEFANKWYINAKADVNHPPIVTDIHGKLITKENSNEIYSGCKGFAVISFYPYSWNGSANGVGVSLRALVKTEDGNPLGGGNFTAGDLLDLLPNEGDTDNENTDPMS